ncbi:MAG: hypothetical protein N2Z69_05755 [Methylophilaceae bacterium]|nr:hypothetical protein [Methylophilaceae bacterium]
MFRHHSLWACALALVCPFPLQAIANDSEELEKIRAEMQQMRASYEARIRSLENQLEQLLKNTQLPEQNMARIEASSARMRNNTLESSRNIFNPSISLILSGLYVNRSQESNDHITGFQTGGEIGPGERGFGLGESELGIYANIDPYFYGGLLLALAPDNSIDIEEAFIQTTALPGGITLKGGRFYSGIGYLNPQHPHMWDFIDSPLVYQAFLGGQYGDDGVQMKWVAPTDLFLEVGLEAGRGRIAGTSGKNKNGSAMGSLFGHIGGDIDTSNSWRAGLSYLHVSPQQRLSDNLDTAGNFVTNQFTGTSRIWVADFVWKWAPHGNMSSTYFKLQGEYLLRRESGTLVYDVDATSLADRYRANQSGWYLQGIYKFMPNWRIGLRYDRLAHGSVDYASNNPVLDFDGYVPQRISWMMDYSPSEFSRLRLQLAHDRSRENTIDNQFFIQYIMSLGAHGAHQY